MPTVSCVPSFHCLVRERGERLIDKGDSGAGWSFLPELMAASNLLPGVKWILPNAPNNPVTINGGMKMPSWYDITSLVDINQVFFPLLS